MTGTTTETENNADNTNAEAALANVQKAVELLDAAIEDAEDVDVSEADTDTLVETVSALKDGESLTEDFRKDEVGDELSERVSVGNSHDTGDVKATCVEGHRKFVFDDNNTLETLEEALADVEDTEPTDVMDVNASDFVELAEELGIDVDDHIGRNTYSYFRFY